MLTQKLQGVRLTLSQWQGDESTLKEMLPEELKDLGCEMETALGRVRSAHAQVRATCVIFERMACLFFAQRLD
jgi:hypothetical protein